MTPLELARSVAWDHLGDRTTLFPDLPLDATLARARAGEWRHATPRLLDLITTERGVDDVAPWSVIDELVASGFGAWPRSDQVVVEAVFDAWWEATLAFHPSTVPVESVLGTLVHTRLPLIRWLEPWVADLDGAPVEHLAELLEGRLQSPVWTGFEDERGQVIGWARTEAVIYGITLVGGVHLGPERLSSVLDLLL